MTDVANLISTDIMSLYANKGYKAILPYLEISIETSHFRRIFLIRNYIGRAELQNPDG